MRVNHRLFFSGVFFIALGLVPLLVKEGWIDQASLAPDTRLWPVLFIATGIAVVIGRGRLALVGLLIEATVVGLFLGLVLARGIGAIGCLGTGNPPVAFPSSAGTLGGSAAEIDITVDCGTTSAITSTGNGWALSGSGDPDRPPRVAANAVSLAISNGPIAFPSFGAARSDWHLQLPTGPFLDVYLETNAGDAHLDLAGARVNSLTVTANAGSVRLDLSEAASIGSIDATVNAGDVLLSLPDASAGASITVNAGHLGVCVPAGTGLRIESSGVLAANNFASRGLIQSGTTWDSPELATKGLQVSLQVTANAGNIELNPAGGCQ